MSEHCLSTLESLIERYDTFFVDIWGVVHDGATPYPNVVARLNQIIDKRKQVLFISNAPRGAHVVVQKLLSFGLHINVSNVLTSGDVLRAYLRKTALDQNFYHLGAERNQDLLADIEINCVRKIEEADKIIISCFSDSATENAQYDKLLQTAAKLEIPALCANPDRIVIHQGIERYCAGFFSERYRGFSGQVHYFGKPDPRIFEEAQVRTQATKVLMIGDTLETDILGAQQASIDSAWILTGNGQKYQTLALRQKACDNLHLKPTWVLEGL